MDAKQRLNLIRDRLWAVYGNRLHGVVGYGSEVRGEATSESDIDILVLLRGPVDYGRDLRVCIHAIYPLVLEWGRPISPEPVDVEEYQMAVWPLYRRVREEGVAV